MKSENASMKKSLTEYRRKYGWRYENFSSKAITASVLAVAAAVLKMLATASKIANAFGTQSVDYIFGTGTWSTVTENGRWTKWNSLTIPGGDIFLISLLLMLPAAIMLILTMRKITTAPSDKCTEEDTGEFMKVLRDRISSAGAAGFLMIGAVIVGAASLNGLLSSYITIGEGISGVRISEPETAELVIIGYVILTVIMSVLFAVSSNAACSKMKKLLSSDDHGVTSSALKKAESTANALGVIVTVLLAIAAAVLILGGFRIIRIHHGGNTVDALICAVCALAVAGMIFILNRYRAAQSSSFVSFLKKSE